jgi:hypothetical protein
MATSFPTSLQDLDATRGTNADSLSAVNHVTHHALEDDTIEALQAKVGADGSAVTTSHDYKLSGVTGSDKAVSKTGTETLTNKTLTAPQINFGSDATGDLIYRSGAGVTSRLAIGTTDQILAVQAGVPAWIANPSATTADTSTAGIVELATTAETETGTDATRAVTPDGLHDMTTLAGAAWFLDEDTMSSDSATKTASQQSIKAYADSLVSIKNGVFNQNANSSTTTTIAHGLGRTPKSFRITGFGGGVNGVWSQGSYNGTNNMSIHKWFDTNGSNSGSNSDNTSCIWISYGSSTGSGQTLYIKGVATWDATNVTITWTVGGAGNASLTVYYTWEAN